MPIYFEMRSGAQSLSSRANADALSEILQDALNGLNVRVVSIRKGAEHAYVYACAARVHPPHGTVVGRLRGDTRLKKFTFSHEAPSSDGPFDWRPR